MIRVIKPDIYFFRKSRTTWGNHKVYRFKSGQPEGRCFMGTENGVGSVGMTWRRSDMDYLEASQITVEQAESYMKGVTTHTEK